METTFQLTTAASSKFVHIFFLRFKSSNILITRIDILVFGKCYPLSKAREHDRKIQVTHAERYKDSDNLFSNKYF